LESTLTAGTVFEKQAVALISDHDRDKREQVMSIVWPERYAPDRVAARVSNEITISAPPATVWAWLVRASLWASTTLAD
jgi:hypothetical protein